MRNKSFPVLLVSSLLKAAVIVSALLGTYLSYLSGKDSFMGGMNVFMFFTIQSNLALALLCAVGYLDLFRKNPMPRWWKVVRLAGTVSITLTGTVFAFVLAPTLGNLAWTLPNILTHVVVPVASVADFFLIERKESYRKSDLFFTLIPPLLYVIYASIAYVCGWEFIQGLRYPYFFLNWGSPAGAFGFSDSLPFMGCVWWILLLLGFIVGIGFLYLALLRRSLPEKKTEE